MGFELLLIYKFATEWAKKFCFVVRSHKILNTSYGIATTKENMLEHFRKFSINEHHLNRYIKFISHRLEREQNFKGHRHHILPRSLFPEFIKEDWNLVLLTEREHYIAHLLLHKSLPYSHEMRYAIWCMAITSKGKISSKEYESLASEVFKNTTNAIVEGIPRKISLDEFKTGKYQHINKNRVDAFDPKVGRRIKVDRDDPRLISGEIYPKVSDTSREASKNMMLDFNKSCVGAKWMTAPDGIKTKNVNASDVQTYLSNGWTMGRDMPWAKNNTGSLGCSWFNDGTSEFLCDPKKAEDLNYNVGRLPRSWINKEGEERQVFRRDVDSFLVDGWTRGRLTKKST